MNAVLGFLGTGLILFVFWFVALPLFWGTVGFVTNLPGRIVRKAHR